MIALRPGIIAKALGISRQTLYRWTINGVIPERAVRPWGKHQIRYDVEELASAGFKLDLKPSTT